MAELLTIARPYADAAFQVALTQGALPSWTDALQRLTAIVASPDAQRLISDPATVAARVSHVVCDVAGQLSGEQRNFVSLLAQNDRLTVLPQIAEQFARLRHEHEQVLAAHVSSAYPLSPTQIDDIRATLHTKYGRSVEVTVAVDPELIGGVSIQIGDEVIDASVRGKLAKLANTLKN
jgi:F-type H+-transporting ATPase subunit delta